MPELIARSTNLSSAAGHCRRILFWNSSRSKSKEKLLVILKPENRHENKIELTCVCIVMGHRHREMRNLLRQIAGRDPLPCLGDGNSSGNLPDEFPLLYWEPRSPPASCRRRPGESIDNGEPPTQLGDASTTASCAQSTRAKRKCSRNYF